MSGTVSVIIPVYNRQHTLMECIESIWAQTYTNYEIILVDDGSTDESVAVCRKAEEQDKRVRVLLTEHVGVSAARNMAIDNACGEYLFFIDSDDVIHPSLLQTLIKGFEEYGADIGGTRVQSVKEENWDRVQVLLKDGQPIGELEFVDSDKLIDRVLREQTPLGMIGGVMMRRDLVADTRFDTQLFIGEDFYFIYQNLVKNPSAVFLKQKWYYGRLHKTNSSWRYDFDGFWTRFRRREMIWESEQQLGRQQNAMLQKKEAFGIFRRCYNRNSIKSEDAEKMRKVIKEYKKDLLKAQNTWFRIEYLAVVYCPGIYLLLEKIHKFASATKRQIKGKSRG